MKTLRLYLWKEWREHRLALLAVVLICAAMKVGYWFFTPRRFDGDPLFPAVSSMSAVLVMLLAVGGELLSERRSGGLTWFERLPAGLGAAFRAKLVFHCATILAAGALGLGLAFAVAWLRGVAQKGVDDSGFLMLFVCALFALWTFSASCWSSRAVLSLFSAGFVLGGLGLPFWYLTLHGYRMDPWEFWAGSALLFGGALSSAWLGFVAGGRRGRGPSMAAGLGFSAAIACFLPSWGWGLWQLHERDRIDPHASGFVIDSVVITDDERTAFAHAWTQNERWKPESMPTYALRITLEDGSWTQVGPRNAQVFPPMKVCRTSNSDVDAIVRVYEPGSQASGLQFDLATGAPLSAEEPRTIQFWWKCAETRGWIERRAPFRPGYPIEDLFTGKSVDLSALSLPEDAKVWSDMGIWYVLSAIDGSFLLDTDSGERTRAEWLDGIESFGPRLPDGCFFVPLVSGGVGLADPRQASVTPLVEGGRVENVSRANGHLPFQNGEVVLLRTGEDVYRFDEASGKLEPMPLLRGKRLVGSTRDGSVFAVTGNKHLLVRVDLDSGEQELLFPRAR